MPFAVTVRLVDQGIDWAAWATAGATVVVAIASVVTAIIVVRTANLAKATLADARRTRHAQLVTQLSQRWDDPEIIESASVGARYGSTGIIDLLETLYASKPRHTGWRYWRSRERNLRTYFKIFLWPNLLESIGCLLEEEAISGDLIYRLWGAEVVGGWEETFKEPVTRLRELQQDEGIYRYFEKLACAMARLHKTDARQGVV